MMRIDMVLVAAAAAAVPLALALTVKKGRARRCIISRVSVSDCQSLITDEPDHALWNLDP
jgi:hypothetical protein